MPSKIASKSVKVMLFVDEAGKPVGVAPVTPARPGGELVVGAAALPGHRVHHVTVPADVLALPASALAAAVVRLAPPGAVAPSFGVRATMKPSRAARRSRQRSK